MKMLGNFIFTKQQNHPSVALKMSNSDREKINKERKNNKNKIH